MENQQEKQRILITIEYDGTSFCGWQSQNGKRCVQSTLESALSVFYGEKLRFMAAEERTQVFMLSAKPLTLMHP